MRRRCAFTLIGLRHFWRRMITGGFTVPVVWKAAKARPCSKPSLQVVGKIFPGPTASLDVHALLDAAVCDEHTRAHSSFIICMMRDEISSPAIMLLCA
jgi:hypothetical protein